MLRRLLLTFVLAVSPMLTQAEITTDTTINIIVPRNPGGLQDAAARFMQHGLASQGYTAVIHNKPGGSDTIALRELERSTNTDKNVYLFSMSHSNIYHPYLYAKPLYDISKSVKPVLYLGEMQLQYYVPKKLNISNIEELKEFVKNNEVFVGSSAIGSSGHLLSLAAFNDTIDNVSFSYYKSDSDNMLALLRGDLTFTLLSVANGNSMGERGDEYVAIPLDYPVPIWQGFVADSTMADQDVKKLNEILNVTAANSEVVEKFIGIGELAPVGGSTEDFQALITTTIQAGENLSKMVQIQ